MPENYLVDGGPAKPVYIINPGGADFPNPFPVTVDLNKEIITGDLITIDEVHANVHEGVMFHAEAYVASLANNGTFDFYILTGAKGAHAAFEVNSGGAAQVFLYEEANVSGGSAVTSYNMNRQSANASSPITVTHTPSIVGVGSTPLINGRFLAGGASQQTRSGGGIRSGTEWILKANTKYLLRCTNISGANIVVNMGIEAYSE